MPIRFFWLALAAIVVALSWAALSGEFIYDDRALPVHPFLDGRDDLLAALGRNSADYLDQADEVAVRSTATWRPLSMLSLLLVQATLGPMPFAHHLLSLALHALVVALLALALRQRGASAATQMLIAAAVALHPALGEAWLWINGRSDLLAGVFLVALAVNLGRSGAGTRRGVREALSVVLLVGGALSKETFLPAALCLVLAEAVGARQLPAQPDGAENPRTGGRRALALWFVAAVVFWFGRAATLGPAQPVLGGGGLPGPEKLLARGPDLVGLGIEALFVPQARGMRFLAWEFAGAAPAWGILAVMLVLGGAGALALRGQHRRALLVLGAAGTLLPAGLVGDAFWLGFDRYLYLPALLLALAVADANRLPRPIWAAGAVGLSLCAWGLAGTAATYASPAEFALGMATLRPDDPTGALLAAREAGDAGHPEAALALLEARPMTSGRPVPAALTHQLAATYLVAGRSDRAAALIEAAAEAHPRDGNLMFDLFILRMSQRRADDALALAEHLLADPARREPTRAQLARWAADPRLPEALRSRCASLAGP